MEFNINCEESAGEMNHFWNSTGFTPAKLLLRPDMEQTIKYYGSVANEGIKYVRIHYLLNLVTANNIESDNPEYDWTELDKGLDLLISNNLRPFFELMGNPAPDFFNDFTNSNQVYAWKNLVKELTEHCINRYGQKEVRKWYFETSNEPDVGWDWGWGGTIECFNNYYDACLEGIKETDPELIFGGPGTCQQLTPFLKGFFKHCDQGTNFFTGETGVRIDFISVHEKGVKAHQEDLNPDSLGITNREEDIIEYLRNNHSDLAKLPFMNNECDPQIGWGHIHTWRAKPYYPAIASKIINQHLLRFEEIGVDYDLLSNDNGFMGTWGNRTLLTRLGDEEEIEKGKFSLIKKPIMNLMSMLSRLGEKRCQIEPEPEDSSDIGVIATKSNQEQIAVLVYHSRDQIMSSGKENIELNIKGIPFKEGIKVHYRIDDKHGNPFGVWEKMGAPDQPSVKQLNQIRAYQELSSLNKPETVNIKQGQLNLEFALPLPAVSLILITNKNCDIREKNIKEISADIYAGINENKEEILLSWSPINSSYLKTYEIMISENENGPFKKLNTVNIIDSCYLHLRDENSSELCYKVRPVYFGGVKGEFSDIVEI